MPRTYKCKTNRGKSYTSDALKDALVAIKVNGQSPYAASKNFHVPRTTLLRHLEEGVKQPGTIIMGRKPVLSIEDENMLVKHIIAMQDRGFGLTSKDVIQLTVQYCVKNSIKNEFSEQLGPEWLYGFKHRHPELSLRLPQKLSIARASCMNESVISKYFDLLRNTLTRMNLLNDPFNIYNCDESGLSLVPDAKKVLAKKGVRACYQICSSERGVLTTALCCMNAAGDYLPPLIVFKGKRMTDQLKEGFPPGTMVCVSDSGYVDCDIFVKFIHHFQNKRRNKEQNCLLILDGHGSHTRNLEALEFAEKNGINLLCLPPHTSHWTQPLDRVYFKGLKSAYNEEVRRFIKNNPGSAFTRHNFSVAFTAAFNKVSTVSRAAEAFKTTGIHPFCPSVIPKQAYEPSKTTDQPLPDNTASTILNMSGSAVVGSPSKTDNQQLSGTTIFQSSSFVVPDEPSEVTDIEPPAVVSTISKVSESLPCRISFDDILPLPKQIQTFRKKSSRLTTARILTCANIREQKFKVPKIQKTITTKSVVKSSVMTRKMCITPSSIQVMPPVSKNKSQPKCVLNYSKVANEINSAGDSSGAGPSGLKQQRRKENFDKTNASNYL